MLGTQRFGLMRQFDHPVGGGLLGNLDLQPVLARFQQHRPRHVAVDGQLAAHLLQFPRQFQLVFQKPGAGPGPGQRRFDLGKLLIEGKRSSCRALAGAGRTEPVGPDNRTPHRGLHRWRPRNPCRSSRPEASRSARPAIGGASPTGLGRLGRRWRPSSASTSPFFTVWPGSTLILRMLEVSSGCTTSLGTGVMMRPVAATTRSSFATQAHPTAVAITSSRNQTMLRAAHGTGACSIAQASDWKATASGARVGRGLPPGRRQVPHV